MTIKVLNYRYRWFDSIMIVRPVDSEKDLFIYVPSECIYRDGDKRYYCYRDEISKRERKNIISLSYNPDKTFGLDCDGTAYSIEYGQGGNYMGYGKNYWDRLNDDKKVESARNAAQWASLGEAFSAIAKNMQGQGGV